MTKQDQIEVNARRKQIENDMENEIDSLMAARRRSVRSIGVACAPQNTVVGKRIGLTKQGYRKTSVWSAPTRRRLKIQ